MPYFVSSVQTGTGSSQDIAHGMGVTPTHVLVIPTQTGVLFGYSSSQGAHDSTNCVVTVSNNDDYIVYAWK